MCSAFLLFYCKNFTLINVLKKEQSNKDACLKAQQHYYENNKEAIKEQAKIKYHNLTREEKDKRSEYAKNWYNNLSEDKINEKRAYGKNRYHNMLEEKKQKLKEYQKMYREKKKQELQSIKEEEDNFDKNAVLTIPET